nr:immunoglobulin light chain junction region [Homo sapiens]
SDYYCVLYMGSG